MTDRIVRRIFFVILFISISFQHGCADAEVSRRDYNQAQRLFSRLAKIAPQSSFQDVDTYVLITAGSGYIELIARTYADGRVFSQDIQQAFKLSGLHLDEVRSQDFATAGIVFGSVNKSNHMARRQNNTLDIGAIKSFLVRHGYSPYIVLRVPLHARTSIEGTAQDSSLWKSRRYTWYNMSKIPADGKVVISASLPNGLFFFLLYIQFILPIVAFITLLFGIFYKKYNKGSLRSRENIYNITALIFLACLLIIISGYIMLMVSRYGDVISDMWFAGNQPASVVLIIGAGIMFVCTFIMLYLSSRNADTEPDLQNVDILVRHYYLASKYIILAFLPMFTYAVLSGIGEQNTLHTGAIYFGILGAILMSVVNYYSRAYTYRNHNRSEILTQRAKLLAKPLGINIHEVHICEFDDTGIAGLAEVRKNTICVAKKAAETLPSEQMDFILGHEIGHFVRKSTLSKLNIPNISIVVVMVAAIILYLVYPSRSLPVFYIPTVVIGMLLYHIQLHTEIRRQMEYEADYIGAVLSGGIEAAVSYMETQCPSDKLTQEGEIHPSTIRRINALKLSADEIKAKAADIAVKAL